MDLFVIILGGVCIFFLLFIVYLLIKQDSLRRAYRTLEMNASRKKYEASVFDHFLETIGSSLDVRTVADSITSISERLFDLSAMSYAVMSDGKIHIATIEKHPLGDTYRNRIQEILLSSLKAANNRASYFPVADSAPISQHDEKSAHESSGGGPLSYFNVPLQLGGEVVGVICVSSKHPHAFSEPDMMVLYSAVSRTEAAFHRLRLLIASEKNTLSSLISSLPGGAMLFHIRGGHLQVSYINRVAREFLNIESENPDFGSVMDSFSSKVNISDLLDEAIGDRKSIVLREVEVGEKYFTVFINPIFYGFEQVVGVSVTMQDITLEKEIERIREDFIHMVVHELRAPLTSIKGASDLLLTQKLTEEQKTKMLSIVNDSVKRMLSDITDLLDAAKIGAGKLTIVPEEGDINQVVKSRAEAFSFLAQEKNMSIQLHLDSSIPKFYFDSMRVGQIVNNLVSNSIKYTQEGGKIDITSSTSDGYCTVSVADNGMGVAPEKQKMLFSKFGQVGSGLKKKGSTGLGLYVCKGIVESHDGKIWIESEEEKGTKISFSIPMKSASDIQKESSEESKTDQPTVTSPAPASSG